VGANAKTKNNKIVGSSRSQAMLRSHQGARIAMTFLSDDRRRMAAAHSESRPGEAGVPASPGHLRVWLLEDALSHEEVADFGVRLLHGILARRLSGDRFGDVPPVDLLHRPVERRSR